MNDLVQTSYIMETPQCSLESDSVGSTNTTTNHSETTSSTVLTVNNKRKQQLYLLVLLRNDTPPKNCTVETVLEEHSYANKPISSPEHKVYNSATIKNLNFTNKKNSKSLPAESEDDQKEIKNHSNSLPVESEDDQKGIKVEIEDTKATFKCKYCEKDFNRKSYRTKHINRVHKRTSRGVEKSKTIYPCALCEKVYDYKNSLQRHVETIHFRIEVKCQFCSFVTHRKYKLKRHIIKVHQNTTAPTITEQFECTACFLKFSNKKKLRYHELKKHNIQRFVRKKINRKCPLCSFFSSKNRKDEINNHFKDEHHIPIEEEMYSFQDIQTFNEWKRQLEIDTKTSFIKAHYSTSNSLAYVCHRRGRFKSRGTNKRQLKMMGSCKINGHCPSEINAKINGEGHISVKFVATHVGHKNELNFIRLRPEERRTIANQLLAKTPHNEILKSVQSSLMDQKLQRIHLLSKKDIINIEKSLLNIGKGLAIDNYKEEMLEDDIHEDDSEPTISEDVFEDVNLVQNEEEEQGKQNRLRYLFEEIIKNAKSKAQIEFVEEKIKETFSTIQTIGSPPGPSKQQVEEDSSCVFPFIDCVYS